MRYSIKIVLPIAVMFAVLLAACGCSSGAGSASSQAATSTSGTTSSATATTSQASGTTGAATSTNATFDEAALVAERAGLFEQKTFTDSQTGDSITYNIYLPEGYNASASYPLVVFIADSSCTGNDPTKSLTQGLGGLVWASKEWQSEHQCIVAVPTYPETILDDHNGYTTTKYVEMTKRFIDAMTTEYAVDAKRVYGTGQSMGCMTTLILASEYPDLYAACMFVDGQWDTSTLSGLEKQKFVYFAAEDDTSAYNGMQGVMSLFKSDNVPFAYQQWDGAWNAEELTNAASSLFGEGANANFISWKTGTIVAGSGSASGSASGGSQGPGASSAASASGGSQSVNAASGSGSGASSRSGGNGGGAMGGASYHMASFDYAYNCKAVMEWVFKQSK